VFDKFQILKSIFEKPITRYRPYLFFFFSWVYLQSSISSLGQIASRDELANAIIETCYRFQFHQSDSLLQLARKPSSKLTPTESLLLEANLIWWKTISGKKDKKSRSRFFEVLDQAQNQIKKEKNNPLETHLKQLSIQGFKTRMAMLDQSYVSGFFQLNSSLNLFSKLLGKENENPLLLIFNGLYHYYWSRSWENYFLLRPYLSLYPKGSIEKGLHLLELATKSPNLNIQVEAHYFLMKIWMDEKKPKQALPHAQILIKKFPQNAVFQYFQFTLFQQLGEFSKASQTEANLLEGLKSNPQITEEQFQHFKKLCKDIRKLK
jgi:hypothetical protein